MRFLKKVLLAVTLCGVTLAAMASPQEPKNGVEYQTLATPQPTPAGKKIEVIEFFAYYCPHCNAFEGELSAWVKKQGDSIVFKRVHVHRDESVLPQQRLFFTLEALGLVEQYHAKIFHAMHVERNRLNSDEAVFDFAEKAGIDRKKFIDTYNSFGVAGRVRHANAMMEAYKVDSWPMVAIDGRFITSPAMADEGVKAARTEAQLHAEAIAVMDFLVAKAKAEKK
ncbi:MAG TPA: disulfide bond formation protein DsbA [Janthinobacterium sp.]|nr:disulfide bond formation protein DsbA [Janthinobacterium sp.]